MDEEQLRISYESRLATLTATANALERNVRDALRDVPHVDRVSFRVKGTNSFLEKVLTRKVDPPYEDPLIDVEDQIAGRVLVFFRRDIESVRTRLSDVLTFVESSRREPKKDDEFGYESHHLVCLIPIEVQTNDWGRGFGMPATFELQIRTLCMHAWAEPQHELGYKSVDEIRREDRRELAWIAASMWGADQAFERILSRQGAH